MTTLTKRATIYFEPILHKALRMKSAETSCSISELINEAVRTALTEDAEDLRAFTERANEPLISYEGFLNKLEEDGRI
ncbi:MAG: CopG family transcriptional regulator [Candidatus Aminicenantes bacterium]|nr:CopG family transcriptional regulator [Candidatus Aminicenantes bacterium]